MKPISKDIKPISTHGKYKVNLLKEICNLMEMDYRDKEYIEMYLGDISDSHIIKIYEILLDELVGDGLIDTYKIESRIKQPYLPPKNDPVQKFLNDNNKGGHILPQEQQDYEDYLNDDEAGEIYCEVKIYKKDIHQYLVHKTLGLLEETSPTISFIDGQLIATYRSRPDKIIINEYDKDTYSYHICDYLFNISNRRESVVAGIIYQHVKEQYKKGVFNAENRMVNDLINKINAHSLKNELLNCDIIMKRRKAIYYVN
jgi:hypothetical protein